MRIKAKLKKPVEKMNIYMDKYRGTSTSFDLRPRQLFPHSLLDLNYLK